MSDSRMVHSLQSTNLADIIERVLDKGIVIAGDIKVLLADVELLSIKIRLVVASVEKAMAMGINWWNSDPYLRAGAIGERQPNQELLERLDRLEARLTALPTAQVAAGPAADPEDLRD